MSVVLDAPQAVSGSSRIALTWRAQGAADAFTVYVRRAEGEPFVALDDAEVGDGAAQFARGAAWRYDWPTARVRVQACDAAGRCADSNEQPLLEALEAGVQTLQPDPAVRSGGYYLDFAFSSDGNTLALDTVPLSVLLRDGDGRWSQDRSAPPRIGNDTALSGDGNTLAIGLSSHRGTVGGVGAPEDEPPPTADFGADSRGAVAVYVRDATGAWQQQTFIKADLPTNGAFFGVAVALSGDGNHLAIGAQRGDTRVYLYERAGGSWRLSWQFQNRPKRQLQPGPLLLSADGRTLALPVAGTYGDDPNGEEPEVIMVNVYRQCACQERWELAAEFQAKDAVENQYGGGDFYGRTLSLSADGKTLAVGNPEDGGGADDDGIGLDNRARNSGAVYVYREGADRRWSRQAFVKTAAAPTFDFFGGSVQLRADGRAFVASTCGRAADTPGLRRLHRADAVLRTDGDACTDANFYVFEEDAEGRWNHTAAAIVPNSIGLRLPVRASADLETIGVPVFTLVTPTSGRLDTVVY